MRFSSASVNHHFEFQTAQTSLARNGLHTAMSRTTGVVPGASCRASTSTERQPSTRLIDVFLATPRSDSPMLIHAAGISRRHLRPTEASPWDARPRTLPSAMSFIERRYRARHWLPPCQLAAVVISCAQIVARFELCVDALASRDGAHMVDLRPRYPSHGSTASSSAPPPRNVLDMSGI